jgi:DNA-binding transcriptional regulator YdaS (Cro superfamily)
MEELIRYFEAQRGRKLKLAQTLGITHGAVSQWKDVPLERVHDVADATGIPPHVLRPDRPQLFPTPPKQEAANV